MEFDDLSRQRLDFAVGPDGEQLVTLTLTLQDGKEYRWTESTDQEEIERFADVIAQEEVNERKIEGAYTEEEIAGMFDWAVDAVKAVGNVAKKVVTSKVFKTAAKGLGAVAPVLGPLAPAALAVSGGMAVASKLGSAAVAAEAGAKRSAKKLTKGAVIEASRRVKGKANRKKLLKVANKKRKASSALASRGRSPFLRAVPGVTLRRRPTGAATGITRRKKPPSVFAAAKRGQLRSLKMGNVTGKKLRKAMKAGRVFWIAA